MDEGEIVLWMKVKMPGENLRCKSTIKNNTNVFLSL